jgi:alkylation response protein AidB-like acyl-CoA dehydrogenase
MDVRFTEDQKEIARQARRFLENESPMEYVRAMMDDERGFTDDVWTKMAELGWLRMCIPEAYDGLGMDLIHIVVVMEEMGRAILPGPFFSTVMLGAEVIAQAADASIKERYLPAIAAGLTRGTLALHEPDGGEDPSYIHMQARKDGDGFILDGVKLFVPDAHTSDFLVCAARTDREDNPNDGITLFLVDRKTDGLSVTLLPTMDRSRKLCSVEFSRVRCGPEDLLGEPNSGWEPLRKILQRAQVGLCAECVGGGQRAMEIASDYAKIRVQFDQPIGAYQAVKHRCATMFQEVESSRSLLYWAAWAQDYADPRDAALAASSAKSYCSEAYKNAANSALQILGATGFSWEHDIHLYLRRAKANEAALGDPVYHREQVAGIIAASG